LRSGRTGLRLHHALPEAHVIFALAIAMLARADIAAGRLIAPFVASLQTRFAYWIVMPEGPPDSPAVTAMRDFIRQLGARDSR
jgi:DNA-binding transcriptional LysR family regulator